MENSKLTEVRRSFAYKLSPAARLNLCLILRQSSSWRRDLLKFVRKHDGTEFSYIAVNNCETPNHLLEIYFQQCFTVGDLLDGLSNAGLILARNNLLADLGIQEDETGNNLTGEEGSSSTDEEENNLTGEEGNNLTGEEGNNLTGEEGNNLTEESNEDEFSPEESSTRGEHIFTFQDVERATERFSDRYRIGKGGFSTVYEAWLPIRGIKRQTAVKKFDKEKTNFDNMFDIYLTIVQPIRHNNMLHIYGMAQGPREAVIITEFMSMGSVGDILRNRQRMRRGNVVEAKDLGIGSRIKIAREITKALIYMHNELKIVHRDVKCDNLLLHGDLQGQWVSKLADFGSLMSMDATDVQWIGTPGFVAERDQPKDKEKLDVFAFGVTVLELITGKGARITARDWDSLTADHPPTRQWSRQYLQKPILPPDSTDASTDNFVLLYQVARDSPFGQHQEKFRDHRITWPNDNLFQALLIIASKDCLPEKPEDRKSMEMVLRHIENIISANADCPEIEALQNLN